MDIEGRENVQKKKKKKKNKQAKESAEKVLPGAVVTHQPAPAVVAEDKIISGVQIIPS